MAHVISDECVSCGSCEAECPVGAISEGDGKYEIDADACVDCGACEAACPTGAISAEQYKSQSDHKREAPLLCGAVFFCRNLTNDFFVLKSWSML